MKINELSIIEGQSHMLCGNKRLLEWRFGPKPHVSFTPRLAGLDTWNDITQVMVGVNQDHRVFGSSSSHLHVLIVTILLSWQENKEFLVKFMVKPFANAFNKFILALDADEDVHKPTTIEV